MSNTMVEEIKQYYLKYHPELSRGNEQNTYDTLRTQRKNNINADNLAGTVSQLKNNVTPQSTSGKNELNNILTKMKTDMVNF